MMFLKKPENKAILSQLTTSSNTPIEYLVNDMVTIKTRDDGEAYPPAITFRTKDARLMCNAQGQPDPSVKIEKGDQVYCLFKIHPYLMPKQKAGLKLVLCAAALHQKGTGQIHDAFTKIPAWSESEREKEGGSEENGEEEE